tara:strand:- start:117 stop:425 length:309 start_codon:yes stop_codon:yes gene_type:complete
MLEMVVRSLSGIRLNMEPSVFEDILRTLMGRSDSNFIDNSFGKMGESLVALYLWCFSHIYVELIFIFWLTNNQSQKEILVQSILLSLNHTHSIQLTASLVLI